MTGRAVFGVPGGDQPPGGAVEHPAATVVLLRGDPLEVLMLRRSSTVAFGGMWVFPGGRVDPGDVDPARPDDVVAAARRAAVREAAEEADVALDADDLVAVSLWVPPPQAPRRYRTWFFAAAVTGAAVTVDGGEIEEHAWMGPAEALERHGAGTIELAPPTWITLWHLGGAWGGSVDEVLSYLASQPPEEFRTQMVSTDDHLVALWQGDAAYDGGDLQTPGRRRRLRLGPGPWQVEWSTPGEDGPATIT